MLAAFASSNLPSKYVKLQYISGDKTRIKFANTSNLDRVCLLSQNVRTINILIVMRRNAQFKFRQFLGH